jgi:hypothetical protein
MGIGGLVMNYEIIDYSEIVKGQCFLIKKFMPEMRCDEFVKHAEKIGFNKADDKYPLSYRTNKRCWEDNETLAQSLWKKLSGSKLFSEEITDACGINSRLRYCRYDSSEVFNIHRDGRYYKTPSEYSKLTFLMYLSDASDYEGGSTRFFSEHNQDSLLCDIKGNKGDVIIFDHRLWHEGGRIDSGTKHILRSDVLFREGELSATNTDHLGYIWKIIYAERSLITGARDTKIKVWDEDRNLIQTISEHESSVLDLAVAGDLLFSCSRDSTIASYQKIEGLYQQKDKIMTTHGTVLSINTIESGGLISSGSDGKICVWSDDLLLQYEVLGHKCWCWQVVSVAEGVFFSIGSDGVVKKWRLSNNKITLVFEIKVSNSALRAIACDDSTYDAWVGAERGEIIHINTLHGTIYSKKKLHVGIVREIIFHNGLVYTCGEDGCVYEVNPRGDVVQMLTLHSDFATSIAVNDYQIYSGGYDGKVRARHLMEVTG